MYLKSLCTFLAVLSFLLVTPVSSSAPKGFSASLRCSDSSPSGVLPTPYYGSSGGVFGVCAESVMSAPLSAVYAAILDFRRYPTWNSFVVSVDVPDGKVQTDKDVYVGMDMTFTTRGLLGPFNSTSDESVTSLEPRVEATDGGDGLTRAVSGWRYRDGIGGVMTAEHLNLLTDLGNGSVRYVSYETYYGVGAQATNLLLKNNLQKQFEAQGQDLKRYVEVDEGRSE